LAETCERISFVIGFTSVAMQGTFDQLQVALSVLIAISASYAALDLAGRVTTATRARLAWLCGGAVAMGIGIWAMHFTGMLAFHLPVAVGYYWPTVLQSLLLTIAASAGALYLVSRRNVRLVYTEAAGIILGGGIAGLHYMDMNAMRMAATCHYNLPLVSISILLAVVFSLAGLGLAFYFRDEPKKAVWRKVGSAGVMGAAISGMHYTGMAAASFAPSYVPPDLTHVVSVSSLGTVGIGVVTLIVLGLAVLTSAVDRRFETQARELQVSGMRYRQLFERSLAGVYRTTVDGHLLDCNDAFARILGFSSRQDYLSETERDVYLNPPEREAFLSQLKQQKTVTNFEIRHRKKDGSPVWLLENATLIAGNEGSQPVIEGTMIDISERKQAEEEVIAESRKQAERTSQEWQQRLELAQKAGLRIGLWDWDTTTNTVVWSDETYRQFGFTRDTFSGRVEEAAARIHPEDRLVVDEAIRKVIVGGPEYMAQYRIIRPDKTICWIDAHGVVVRNGPTHVLGIGIDITSLKQTERSLQEAKAELIRVTRIATMGELTASIAHEINQPLAAVVTNGSASLHWLAMQPPNLYEVREAITRAIREANRASDVIRSIRAMLRKTSPKTESLDVNEVIRDVLRLTNSELLAGGAMLRSELADDVPAVLADRIQLQQVMLNLIMNGIESMSSITDRPRDLLIRSTEHPEGLLIQVQDSGEGLDLAQADHIFDAFFSTKPQGLGMGLSISRSIIEAHGGRLWVTPRSPHGAVFQFILPRTGNTND
jgi:PAS domain S-box-containing protein